MCARPANEVALDLTDRMTFAQVHREHAPSVHRTAVRILRDHGRADDVTQEVFLRVWTNPRAFDHRRGDLGAYLRMMARSRAIDLWRQINAPSSPLIVDGGRDEGPARSADQDLTEMVERRTESTALRRAVRELPPDQRDALVLFYWGGMTSEEIARSVGVPLGMAKSRIRLALARLRRCPEALGA